jgi:hypothetical protein
MITTACDAGLFDTTLELFRKKFTKEKLNNGEILVKRLIVIVPVFIM